MVATPETKNLLERATVLTATREWKTVEEAKDFFQSSKVQSQVYKGSELSVKFDGGHALLGIKRGAKHIFFPLRDSGMETILQKVGMGAGNYPIDVCDNHLVEYNVNYLFKNMLPEQEFTVIANRHPGDEGLAIKSVMSDAYQHVPHLDVLNVLNGLDIEYKVHTLNLTKDFFRINVSNPANKVQGVKVGDISSIGVDLVNSENGRSALTMSQFIYRYWCTNGASRVDESGSIRSKAIHRGGRIDQYLADFTKGARYYLINGAAELERNFKLLAEKPVTETFLRKATEKLEAVINKKGTEALVDEWKKSVREIPCSEAEFKNRGMENYENNRYDFTQLVTRAAHRDYRSQGDKRLGLEKVGGWLYSTAATLN